MASKKYAYYNKGNKIGIIQKDNSDINSDDYSKYKSPVETVTNGLEIEYSYAPTYNFSAADQYGTSIHRFIGYGSTGTNLVLFTFGYDDYADLSSIFDADQKIYINSGPFEGVHETLQAGTNTGILVLKTKFYATPNTITSAGDFNTAETYYPDSAADRKELALFKEQQEKYPNKYIFIQDAAADSSKGFFSLNEGESDLLLYFNQRYIIQDSGTTTKVNDIITEAAVFSASNNDTVNIYNAFYEPMLVHENIDVIQDESFELDLTRYQANAVVYYLRAKAAEDMMDIEKFEYYMTSFRKQMKKAAGSRKRGPYISQGFWNMK